MPELDTYKIIERYARAPRDLSTVQAYRFLKRRTELTIRWRSFCASDFAPLKSFVDYYIGHKDVEKKSKQLADMKEEDRQDLFKTACASMGIELDPALFTSKSTK